MISFVLENYLNTIKFSSSWPLKISRKTGYVGQKFTTRGAKVYTVRKLSTALVYQCILYDIFSLLLLFVLADPVPEREEKTLI